MPELTEAERQCLTETQSLTRDEAGRDVLVGLTYEESSLLMVYRRQFATGNRDLDPINCRSGWSCPTDTRLRDPGRII